MFKNHDFLTTVQVWGSKSSKCNWKHKPKLTLAHLGLCIQWKIDGLGPPIFTRAWKTHFFKMWAVVFFCSFWGLGHAHGHMYTYILYVYIYIYIYIHLFVWPKPQKTWHIRQDLLNLLVLQMHCLTARWIWYFYFVSNSYFRLAENVTPHDQPLWYTRKFYYMVGWPFAYNKTLVWSM